MAEPSATAAAPSALAADRDALLATKLNVPGPRPGLVPRPRLSERLDEGLRRGPGVRGEATSWAGFSRPRAGWTRSC